MNAPVRVDELAPHVRAITLDRPERLNALDGPTLEALSRAVRDAAAPDAEVRVIVLPGTGRAFCSGNDLKWLAAGVLADPVAHQRHQDLMQATFEALEAAPQIVIASVQGHAVAGGLELALASDIVVVAQDAALGDEHLRRDLLPSGGSSQRLPRRIGLPRALYYLLSGRRMTGGEAERIGLAALAVAPDRLADETLALATEIAKADPLALASMKSLARRSADLPLREGLALERWTQHRYRIASPSLVDGVRRFADRTGGHAGGE